MVEAVKQGGGIVRARKTLNRFTVWENKLELEDKDLPKVEEAKMKITRVEFKNESTPMEKTFESRVMVRPQYVTKGYSER